MSRFSVFRECFACNQNMGQRIIGIYLMSDLFEDVTVHRVFVWHDRGQHPGGGRPIIIIDMSYASSYLFLCFKMWKKKIIFYIIYIHSTFTDWSLFERLFCSLIYE